MFGLSDADVVALLLMCGLSLALVAILRRRRR